MACPKGAYVEPFAGAGPAGHADGTGTAALFDNPLGICIDAVGEHLYVVETGRVPGVPARVRRIEIATAEVTTVVEGLAPDAPGANSFRNLTYCAIGPVSGDLYVTKGRTGSTISSPNGEIFRVDVVTGARSSTALVGAPIRGIVVTPDEADVYVNHEGLDGVFHLRHGVYRVTLATNAIAGVYGSGDFEGAGQMAAVWAAGPPVGGVWPGLLYDTKSASGDGLPEIDTVTLAVRLLAEVGGGGTNTYGVAISGGQCLFFTPSAAVASLPYPASTDDDASGLVIRDAPVGFLAKTLVPHPDPAEHALFVLSSPTGTTAGINDFTSEGIVASAGGRHAIDLLRLPDVAPPLRGFQRGDDLWGSARGAQRDTRQRSIRGSEAAGSYW